MEPRAHDHKKMGLWMKENIPDVKDKRICAMEPGAIFYSGAQALVNLYYFENYSEFMDYIKTSKVDYIIIDERTFSRRRPPLAFLLEEDKDHAGLTKVHTIRTIKKIILYKVE